MTNVEIRQNNEKSNENRESKKNVARKWMDQIEEIGIIDKGKILRDKDISQEQKITEKIDPQRYTHRSNA